MHVCLSVCVYTNIHACIYIHVYIFTYVCIRERALDGYGVCLRKLRGDLML